MKRLIDIRALSLLTGISVHTLYSWVSQRKIPFIKLGKLLRFDLVAVEKWFEEHAVPTKDFEKLR